MRKVLLSLAALVAVCWASAQNTPYKTVIPDIPGYKTLKCDFHIHTIFSDGHVTPETRVNEAAREGLDAIAVTDHIEYRPNHRKGTVNSDFNESFRQASAAAASRDVMVIPGCEITRGMPPGHWNAIFVKDANKFDVKDWKDAFDEAVRQEAFLMWNHPGWLRQQPNETLFLPEHEELYRGGYMMGVEVANHACSDYYPEAHRWAMEKNITMVGNTDIHAPIGMMVDFTRGEHRDMTLVFAADRTEEALKEALLAGRTAVYAGENIYGRMEYLLPLAESIIGVRTVGMSDNGRLTFELTNNSSVPIYLRKGSRGRNLVYLKNMILRPYETIRINVTGWNDPGALSGPEVTLSLLVTNFHIDVDEPLPLELTVKTK